MLFALDKLMRGHLDESSWVHSGGDWDAPVVVEEDGKFFVATANRRLTVLQINQALNRHKAIEVTCKIESLENNRWNEKFYGAYGRVAAKSTETEGLSVSVNRQRRTTSLPKLWALAYPDLYWL